MSVLITGSIAYDAVFSFAGAFGEQITRPVEPGFNTTFLTRAMRRDFGGCAGNIAVAMKRMGGEPLSAATAAITLSISAEKAFAPTASVFSVMLIPHSV